MLRAAFATVELRRYDDDLRCTDPADVEAYLAFGPAEFDRHPRRAPGPPRRDRCRVRQGRRRV